MIRVYFTNKKGGLSAADVQTSDYSIAIATVMGQIKPVRALALVK